MLQRHVIMLFSSDKSAKKEKQAASSTKWGLVENIVLRLMKCLTPTFNLIYLLITISHLSVCLPTLELMTFVQQVFSEKIVYENALSLGTNNCKKRNVVTLNSTHQTKKQCNFDSGWLERQHCGQHHFFWILRT